MPQCGLQAGQRAKVPSIHKSALNWLIGQSKKKKKETNKQGKNPEREQITATVASCLHPDLPIWLLLSGSGSNSASRRVKIMWTTCIIPRNQVTPSWKINEAFPSIATRFEWYGPISHSLQQQPLFALGVRLNVFYFFVVVVEVGRIIIASGGT